MALQVTGLAVTQCMWGVAPSVLMVLPIHMEITFIMPGATITDTIPFLNMMPFIMCQSKVNPMVIAIMIASLGSVQVAPCIPMTFIPWTPPMPKVLLSGVPTIDNTAMAMCLWAGKISITVPGQVKTIIL